MSQLQSILKNVFCILITAKKIKNIYIFFRERTTMMSLLNGLGKAVFPLAEFVSGQLYKVCSSLFRNKRFMLDEIVQQNS